MPKRRVPLSEIEKKLARLPPITVIAIAADSGTLAEFLTRALTVAAGEVERTVIKERARRTRAARKKKPVPVPVPVPAPEPEVRIITQRPQRVSIRVPTELAYTLKKKDPQ